MPQADRWLDATWPRVREQLPDPPARVLELGCGTVGGHVPRLRAAGYDAIGVDPAAPDGTEYRQVEFERHEPEYRSTQSSPRRRSTTSQIPPRCSTASSHPRARRADCPHRVGLGGVRRADGGVGLPPARPERRRELASHAPRRLGRLGPALERVPRRLGGRARHPSGTGAAPTARGAVPARTAPRHGPYLFADLDGTTEEDEQAAIAAGEISATRVEVVGSLP